MRGALDRAKMLVGMEVAADGDDALEESASFTASSAMGKMRGALGRARTLVGMEADEEVPEQSASFIDDFNRQCTLTTQQRLYGFATCLAAGLACTFLSMLVFFNPVKFGITFTFGNLLALGSTAFLIGPKRQVVMMLDPVRIYATAIYLASIIIALFCALYVHNKLLTLLAIVLEFGALFWGDVTKGWLIFLSVLVSSGVYFCVFCFLSTAALSWLTQKKGIVLAIFLSHVQWCQKSSQLVLTQSSEV